MRKSSGFWGVMGLALVLFGGTTLRAMAQDNDKPAGDKDQRAGSWDKMGGRGMGPMGRMKEKLGLSDDQAAKVKDLFQKQREELKPLREQSKIDMDNLRLKVDSKAPDSEIKKILEALAADRKKMEAGRQAAQEQISALLTPTQRAKLLLGMRGPGGEMRRGMMKRRMGGMEDGHSDQEKSPAQDM